MDRRFTRRIASTLASAAALALFTFHLPHAARAQGILDGIAAVVNSDVITYSQMRQIAAPRERALMETLRGNELIDKIKEVRTAAINKLIDRTLLVQELKRMEYPVRPGITDQAIDLAIKREFESDRKTWLERLRKHAYIKVY